MSRYDCAVQRDLSRLSSNFGVSHTLIICTLEAGPRLSRDRACPSQRRKKMNNKKSKDTALGFFLVLFSIVAMTGFGSSQPAAPTSAPQPTQQSAPALVPILMPTNTPRPTATMESSPTSIPLPEGITDIVSNAAVKHQDTFNYSFLSPTGWASCPGLRSSFLFHRIIFFTTNSCKT
jgi:hypothetical protein